MSTSQFLPFVASLRSLTESCVDSWYTISRIEPTLLGEKSLALKKAINGELETLLINSELEELLIHYSHGRKIKKSDRNKYLESHNALQPYQYFEFYQKTGGKFDLKKVYDVLSQFAHPSMLCTNIFSYIEHDELSTYYSHPINNDKKLIRTFILENKQELSEIIKLAISPPLSLLKSLNKIGLPEIQTAFVDEISF